MFLIYRWFIIAILFFPACLGASLLWHDSKGGVTRDYYHRAAGLPWDKKLGDWLDKNGVAWGDASYAEIEVFSSQQGQYLSLDATALVNKWLKGANNQGFLIRSNQSSIKFSSRENLQTFPLLELVFESGKHTLLAGSDAVVDLSTAYSLGYKPYLKVSKVANSVLWFDLKKVGGQGELLSAELKLYIEKVFGHGGKLSLYEVVPAPLSSKIAPIKQGLSDSFPADQGLEKHKSVYYVEQFEGFKSNSRWLSDGVTGDVIDSNSSNKFQPLLGRSLSVEIKKGKRLGLNQRFRFAERGYDEPEEAYFRYYLRLGDDWNQTVSGGKLPGFAGTYGKAGWGGRKSNGYDGWSSRGHFLKTLSLPGSDDLRTPIGNYVYYADQKGDYGESWIWNESGGALLENNRWYCIEQYLHLNDPDLFNGELIVWLDGRQVFSKKDIQFRASANLKIEEVWFNVYHGGMANAKKSHHLFLDNVVVAKEYIGPMADQ